MRLFSIFLIVAGLLIGSAVPAWCKVPEDLETIKADHKLQRRAKHAMKFARRQVDPVLKAYQEGDTRRGEALLLEIQEAVELAYESLKATGKNPHKKPKHFKKAEIRSRKLMNELDDVRRRLNYEDREALDKVYARIEEINKDLLMGILTKKKKK